MEWEEAIDFLQYVLEQNASDRLFLRWAIWYQHEVDFAEFCESCRPKPVKPKGEILRDVAKIADSMRG